MINNLKFYYVIYKKMTNYMYVSPGKHTVAIKNDGDIISYANVDVKAGGEYTIRFMTD